MEKWVLINRKEEYLNITKDKGIDPLIARVLGNRGVKNSEEAHEFLEGDLKDLEAPSNMKDLEKGVEIIKEAIETGEAIVIYGDYDCDGVSATAILYRTLKHLGGNFSYHIPSREEEGYGMNSNRVRKLYEKGTKIILTCDNGISALDQVALAKDLGMKVIITDHHEVPFVEENGVKTPVLPLGDCVINPKQEDCSYKFKELCGAAVALKFSMELCKAMKVDFMEELGELFQLAAIATICDVVELKGENRIIVKEGLKRINKSPLLGLKALIKATLNQGKEISEYHFGFVLGPCINATGRLETADLSVELLISEKEEQCEKLSKELYELNKVRQELTLESVERVLQVSKRDVENGDKVLVIYDKEIHESIAGIVAGRIREAFNRPTIVLTKGKEMPKGSGRSIEGYNMFEELTKVKDILHKFGGHPMAAGLSLEEDKILELKNILNSNTILKEEDFFPVIKIDSPLALGYLNEGLIENLESLRPFGKGNSSPLFAIKDLEVLNVYFIGKEKKILKFRFGNSKFKIEGINFDKYDEFKEGFINKYGSEEFLKLQDNSFGQFKMDIIYYPSINEFNGRRNIQLSVKNFRL